MSKKDTEPQYDFELSDGTKGTIDKSKLTIGEWRDFWNPQQAPEDSDALLSKVTGLVVDRTTLYEDFQRLCVAFRKKCQEPLEDPKK